MRKIDVRKIHILKLIVEEYIKTGDVMGSKNLLKKHDVGVSSATIRNDMASLEKMGLIFQPYNSAGRLPTNRGLRVFVDYLMEHFDAQFIEAEAQLVERNRTLRVDDALYEIVSRLTKVTGEITFACVPSLGASYYLGLSNYLEKNIPMIGSEAYGIIKVLENRHHFLDFLQGLDVTRKVSVFIGEESVLPEFETSAVIVKKIEIEGHEAYVGILGSLQMDYAFNIAALRSVL